MHAPKWSGDENENTKYEEKLQNLSQMHRGEKGNLEENDKLKPGKSLAMLNARRQWAMTSKVWSKISSVSNQMMLQFLGENMDIFRLVRCPFPCLCLSVP